MEGLRDCLELVRSTWLATSFHSCFQKPQDGGTSGNNEPAAPGISTSFTTDQLEKAR